MNHAESARSEKGQKGGTEPPPPSLCGGSLLILLSALLYSLSFPPAHFPALGWVALAPLFVGLARTPPRWGFLLGWLWAFVVGCGTAFFVPTMFETYFDLARGAALVASLAAILLPGIWVALFGAWLAHRRRWGPVGPFEIAAVWGGTEWARATLGIANPWSLSGYSQTTVLPALQGASIFGIVGLGMLLALVGAAIAGLSPGMRPPHARRSLVAVGLILFAWFGFGFLEISRDHEAGPEIRIGIVQANLPRRVRIDPNAQASVLERHLELTRVAARGGAELIVWPEYALERKIQVGSPAHRRIATFTRDADVGLIFGTTGSIDGETTNTTLLFEAGRAKGRYDKVDLMPFGESRPLNGLLGGHHTGLRAGFSRAPLDSSLAPIGVLVCSEIMSAAAARETTKEGAMLLVNLANDEWLGPLGLRQQLQIATARAVENQRYLIRATHSGITAVIDPKGRILERAAENEAGVLMGNAAVLSGISLYQRWGDGPVGCAAAAALVHSAFAYRRHRRRTLAPCQAPTPESS